MILAKWLEMCSIALVYHILLIEEGRTTLDSVDGVYEEGTRKLAQPVTFAY